MTHTKEQERALADLRHMYAQMVGGMVKDSAQAKRIADGILSRAIQKLEQAARRAPAVPQGWKLVPVELLDRATESLGSFVSDHGWGQADMDTFDDLSALAAAPQPPEEAQLDDTNVADMAQAVDSKEAAHVQLPEAEDEPSSCAYCGQPSDEPRKPLSDAAIRDLYSEEVCWDMVAPYVIAFARSIEAAHGIKEQST